MNREDKEDLDGRYKRLAISLAAGSFVATVGYGALAGKTPQAMMAALLVAAAPFALGGLLGFLFGIPKTLQGDGNQPTKPGERQHAWVANTNLEQVSDWLTKILLGIGLTQLTQLPDNVESAGDYIARCIGGAANGAVGSAILICFSISGFIIGYLITKFDLGNALDEQNDVLDAMTKAASDAPSDRRTVQGLVFASLYVKEPAGFDNAIQSAEAYLNRASRDVVNEPDDGALNAYLACAYAQKYAYERDVNQSNATVLGDLRRKALLNVTTAIRQSVEWKGWFRQLANPQKGSTENDLLPFKDDPDFLRLVGPAASDPLPVAMGAPSASAVPEQSAPPPGNG